MAIGVSADFVQLHIGSDSPVIVDETQSRIPTLILNRLILTVVTEQVQNTLLGLLSGVRNRVLVDVFPSPINQDRRALVSHLLGISIDFLQQSATHAEGDIRSRIV